MTYSTFDVTNTVLEKAFSRHTRLNVIQLQRILFLLDCEYRQLSGATLPVGQWACFDYGPALWSIHYKCECLRNAHLSHYLRDAADNSYVVGDNPELTAALERIWPRVEKLNTVTLCEITRAPGSPWRAAWDNDQTMLDDDLVTGWTGYRDALNIPHP